MGDGFIFFGNIKHKPMGLEDVMGGGVGWGCSPDLTLGYPSIGGLLPPVGGDSGSILSTPNPHREMVAIHRTDKYHLDLNGHSPDRDSFQGDAKTICEAEKTH